MKSSIPPKLLSSVKTKLKRANQEFQKIYPGERPLRQPIHTVYGGAHLFRTDYVSKLGSMALTALTQHAPNDTIFAKALTGATDIPRNSAVVYERVIQKLKREPIEDYRIDFEDGFGIRADKEEDEVAERSARELAQSLHDKILSPYVGIRIKSLTEELKARAIRTLDIFLTTLLKASAGQLPPNFIVTLPKVTVAEEVTSLCALLKAVETRHRLRKNSLNLEIMIETPQSIVNEDGNIGIGTLVRAAQGRCSAVHFGPYDYTASCNITGASQALTHPSCDFAREFIKVALAGTGVWFSDGPTNIMPLGNEANVHQAWRLSFHNIRHALRMGCYQGWDLHPAQLPVRYAASYSFFLESLEIMTKRLKNFIEKAAQATVVGNIFDDAATGKGLLNFFSRALNCGAITAQEVEAAGLTVEQLRGSLLSFV